MKIIDPKVEIIIIAEPLKRIEICGRVCYKSESKITETSARGFVERIVKSGHTSVLEHARVIVPMALYVTMPRRKNEPYGFFSRYGRGSNFIVINARDFVALGGEIDALANLENSDDYMTVRFTCDRAIANELVRHRVFSFSQESTRYVNYKNGIEFVRPIPFEWAKRENKKTIYEGFSFLYWCEAMQQAEVTYKMMVETYNRTPQEARGVLPLSTKTELIMTGTFKQWKEMLQLRTAPSAHPQMRYLMDLLLTQMAEQPNDLTSKIQ